MKNNVIVISLIAALVGGGIGAFGGIKYQQSKSNVANTGNFAGRPNGLGNRRGGQNGQGRFENGGRMVTGEILSLDDKSLTVKLQDGSSKLVLIPTSVTISKTDTASKADLKTGNRIGVFGTDNSDGSVTAQNIQLNPMFRTGSGGSPSATGK